MGKHVRPRKPKGVDMLDHMRECSAYPESGCWVLPGHPDKDGYQKVIVDSRTYQAHRYGFMRLRYPDLTPDILLLHQCDNPPCWNPDHMQPGSHAANMADKVAKGRQYEPIHIELPQGWSPSFSYGQGW